MHYMLLLNVEVHFLDNISKGNANSSRTTHTLNIYGGTIDVRFVLSSKGTLACNSSSSVLVLNRTSPSLLHTFVVDTLLNFPLPFNIPVILTYTNTSRVHSFGRLPVFLTFPYPEPVPKKICDFYWLQLRITCTSRKKILRQQRREK